MSSLHSLIAFRIPWFQISPSALVVRHGLFQGRPILLHAACSSSLSLQQLAQLAMVPPISHVLLFRVRNNPCPGSLVARVALH
jgi:hypothetical protein